MITPRGGPIGGSNPGPRAGSRQRWWAGLAAAAASALGALGCAEELGPEPMPTARVSGRVHVADRPVGGGWIEFHPVGRAVGKLRSAPIRPDGTFDADRVAVGTNAIQIAAPPLGVGPLGEGSDEFLLPFLRAAVIRREIPEGGTSGLDIDLLAEYLRFHKGGPAG